MEQGFQGDVRSVIRFHQIQGEGIEADQRVAAGIRAGFHVVVMEGIQPEAGPPGRSFGDIKTPFEQIISLPACGKAGKGEWRVHGVAL